jgi:hypothetical protein
VGIFGKSAFALADTDMVEGRDEAPVQGEVQKKIKKVFTPVTRAIIMAPTHQDICKAVDKLEKEVNNSLKSMS